MFVLSLFDSRTEIPFRQIVTETSISEKEVTDILNIFAENKLILREGGAKSPYLLDEKIVINDKFEHKQAKVNFFGLLLRIGRGTGATRVVIKEGENDELAKMRKLILDANIVRVMKANKTLYLNDLVEKVMNISKTMFIPQPDMIKACIEDLMSRDFLERDPKERTKFIYKP